MVNILRSLVYSDFLEVSELIRFYSVALLLLNVTVEPYSMGSENHYVHTSEHTRSFKDAEAMTFVPFKKRKEKKTPVFQEIRNNFDDLFFNLIFFFLERDGGLRPDCPFINTPYLIKAVSGIPDIYSLCIHTAKLLDVCYPASHPFSVETS